jgi:3-dehydroquinate dehydratase-1
MKEPQIMSKIKTVLLGKVEVGKGTPKVIVPIVGKTREEIVTRGQELTHYPLDVVEWRVDFYTAAFDIAKVMETGRQLRVALKDIPIIFTFRTKKEGGEKEITPEYYTALNKAMAESDYVEALDVEIFSGDTIVRQNIANIHSAGKIVVGSSHDFLATPAKAELISRLRKMQELGADIPKLAVMPHTGADVITLLSATQEMCEKYANRPIITMSMGKIGVISRLTGEAFGSSMTFGAVGQVSAPGQIPVEKLQTAMAIIHEAQK